MKLLETLIRMVTGEDVSEPTKPKIDQIFLKPAKRKKEADQKAIERFQNTFGLPPPKKDK